jgi:3-isopropylmalate dehydrogenase
LSDKRFRSSDQAQPNDCSIWPGDWTGCWTLPNWRKPPRNVAPDDGEAPVADLTIGILKGDDIGHEIVPAAVNVAKAAASQRKLDIDWRSLPIGRTALESHGSTLPAGTLETLSQMDGFILAPMGHRAYPKVARAINPHRVLRKHFGLFANVRPTRSFPGLGVIYDDIDLVIVRENNEGVQPDRNMVAGGGEFRPTEEVTISVRVITRVGSYRVARAALELARQRRHKLTIVHKDRVFKLGCGMFVEECQRAAREFPDIVVDDVVVDTFARCLVRDPQSFDVVVTINMFGDILSDAAAGLVGGLGMVPGLCIGEGKIAMAQATHGSAPGIAGQGLANPYAMMESTRMLFSWLGHHRGITQAIAVGKVLERVLTKALADPTARTRDICGTGNTHTMKRAVTETIAAEHTDAVA